VFVSAEEQHRSEDPRPTSAASATCDSPDDHGHLIRIREKPGESPSGIIGRGRVWNESRLGRALASNIGMGQCAGMSPDELSTLWSRRF
jgi:hypothetical protein